MDFRQSADEARFRAEVVDFLEQKLPERLRMRQDGAQLSTRAETLEWQRILNDRGWGAPHWPTEYGGPGWTPQQRLIFDMECAALGAPWTNHQGVNLLGPVVNKFGTPEQRERFIPPLLRGESYWVQGFSEPNSGSDLASLQTTAKLEGDHYVVNGQKIWTSHALHADWIFLLVRTSKEARKQQGISFMVAPIDAPGITVRPIKSIDGLVHLTEVFLDDLKIPVEDLIGAEGEGWSITKHALGMERLFGACDIPGMVRDLTRLKRASAIRYADGSAPIDDPVVAYKLARIDMEAEAVSMSFVRAISMEGEDTSKISSIIKVKVTEIHQRIAEFLYEVLGDRGPLFYPDPYGQSANELLEGIDRDLSKASSEVMYRRASSIYGGTNEIQRDILAKIVLSA